MTTREIPEPWSNVLAKVGITSVSGIVARIKTNGGNVTLSTVGDFLDGVGKYPKPATIRGVAGALNMKPEAVMRIRDQVIASREGLEPFYLKPEAAILSDSQRQIVEDIVAEFIGLQRIAQESAPTNDVLAQPTDLAEKRRKSRNSRPHPLPPSMRDGELYAAQDSDEPKGADPAGKDDGEE